MTFIVCLIHTFSMDSILVYVLIILLLSLYTSMYISVVFHLMFNQFQFSTHKYLPYLFDEKIKISSTKQMNCIIL